MNAVTIPNIPSGPSACPSTWQMSTVCPSFAVSGGGAHMVREARHVRDPGPMGAPPLGGRLQHMFVRCFTELSADHSAVDAALTTDVQDWLPGLMSRAEESGERRLAEVGFGHAVRVERCVEVFVGAPARVESTTILPIAWRPAGGQALFPAMSAEIELAPVGEDRTQLAIGATYTPPFGLVGRVADRALLHRVAEATIKDFLDRVRDRLQEHLSTEAGRNDR
jgi:hypothetical protein